MDYFTDVLATFLCIDHDSILDTLDPWYSVYGGSESSDSTQNILICVPKMNKGITGLERHEGE